jgi:hypothetical protein
MKLTSVLFTITTSAIIFMSCDKGIKVHDPNPSILRSDIPKSVDENQKEAPEKVVKDFLSWYGKNFENIYQFQTIKGGPAENPENSVNYYVDFKVVEEEINYFKKAVFFTDNFLNQYKNIFVEGEKRFKKDPQNDGPPDGFDYDYFMMTQDDFEKDLKNVDQLKFDSKKIDDQTSSVIFEFKNSLMKYKYTLKSNSGKWQIDKIENISGS